MIDDLRVSSMKFKVFVDCFVLSSYISIMCKIDFVVRELSRLLQGIVNKILSLSQNGLIYTQN